jgi:nitrite reductase [NAD(P)H] small subunit
MAMEKAIGRVTQIPKGEGRTFEVNGFPIAVFRTHTDEIFATQAACPHRGGPLADGLIGEASVVCPLHDWTFDLRTGVGKDCRIETYPVRTTEDGRIMLIVDGLSGSTSVVGSAESL